MISGPLSYRDFVANGENKLTWFPEIIQECLLLPRKQIYMLPDIPDTPL